MNLRCQYLSTLSMWHWNKIWNGKKWRENENECIIVACAITLSIKLKNGKKKMFDSTLISKSVFCHDEISDVIELNVHWPSSNPVFWSCLSTALLRIPNPWALFVNAQLQLSVRPILCCVCVLVTKPLSNEPLLHLGLPFLLCGSQPLPSAKPDVPVIGNPGNE